MVLAHTRAQLFNEWISAVCSRWSFLKFDQCRVVLLLLLLLLFFTFFYVKMGERETDEGRCLACSAVQKRTQSTPWTFALLLFCFKIRIDFSPLFWKQQPKQKQQNADWILEVFTKLAGKFSRAIIKNEEREDSRPTDLLFHAQSLQVERERHRPKYNKARHTIGATGSKGNRCAQWWITKAFCLLPFALVSLQKIHHGC